MDNVPGQQLSLKGSKLEVCSKCETPFLEPKMIIRKVSQLEPTNTSGKDQYVTLQLLVCSECGTVKDEYQKLLAEKM